ncbi:MAG: TonB-dependent receptor [Bacteroides sp.]|nr:TonB-dependent receptor [Bacteroides sp.]
MIKGTNTGEVTDINGYYVIDVPSVGTVLEFTSLGFRTETVAVPKSLALDIVLMDDTLEMDEAVVVGMGHQRKASVIGAISAVPKDELMVPQRNLTNTLAGKIAGAVVVQRSGEPGMDNAEFWIRGISSLNSSAPLVLVDGVERDMSNLSIEEIENISVLKDASATAVYGVRAANGVVLVTTRKGQASQRPVIDVKIESGLSEMSWLPEFIDGPNYMRMYNEAVGYSHYTPEQIEATASGIDPYLYPDVNWMNELFTRWANNTSASINIRGGGERARYYVTAAYMRDNGNLYTSPETDYSTNIHVTRYNFRSNIDINLTKSTILSLEIGANMTDSHQPATAGNSTEYSSKVTALFNNVYNINPTSMPVRVPVEYDEYGDVKWGWGTSSIGSGNPAERLFGSGYNKTYNTQIMSQIILRQDLGMVTPGLSANVSFSYDYFTMSAQVRSKTSSTYMVLGVNDETGLYDLSIREGQDYLNYAHNNTGNRADELKGQINYDRNFADRHRVGAMFMYYHRNYVNLAAGSAIFSLPYRKQGLAFRATYSYDDRYFAEFNAGYNGSENFEKGHRFGFFPAGALGYLISNEPWFKRARKYVNHLKVRGSVGLVGSDVLASSQRFGYLSTWGGGLGANGLNDSASKGHNHYFGPNATSSGTIGEAKEGIVGLTWEKGLKRDIGLEVKLLNSMISLDFDYFYENRWDILIQRKTIPSIAGLNEAPLANMGRVNNWGFEGTGEFNHHIGPVNYRLYGNFSFARNKVIEKDEPQTDPWRMETGRPINQCFGLIALGYFKDEADIKNSPEQAFGTVRPGDVKYLDYNNDGKVDDHDQVAIGYSNVPEINYGFGAQIGWKGFDAGVFFRGQGNVTYYLGGMYFPFQEGVGRNNLYANTLDHWSVENPNPDARYPRLSAMTSSNNQKRSTKTIYDGSFIRLSDVEVGYTLKASWLSSWGCQAIRIYFVGSNLWMHSKWDMWDPETGSQDGRAYPLTRKYNFGLRLTF